MKHLLIRLRRETTREQQTFWTIFLINWNNWNFCSDECWKWSYCSNRFHKQLFTDTKAKICDIKKQGLTGAFFYEGKDDFCCCFHFFKLSFTLFCFQYYQYYLKLSLFVTCFFFSENIWDIKSFTEKSYLCMRSSFYENYFVNNKQSIKWNWLMETLKKMKWNLNKCKLFRLTRKIKYSLNSR